MSASASPERVTILGPGAMGLLHAAYLRRAGTDVTLLDYRPERAERLNAGGLRVERSDGEWRIAVPCRATPDFGPVDLLVVFVKAYATRAALAHARPLIGRQTVLLTLQNGLGNLEILREFQAPELVLAGTTSSGATLLGEGHIRQAGLGQIILGPVIPPSPGDSPWSCRRGTAGGEAAAVAALFTTAGLPATTTDDVLTVLWRKAIINAAINPLTALTGRRNGELLADAALRELLGQVAAEGATVAQALGLDLDPAAMPAQVEDICRLTANNCSSMLQDVTAGRRTEIDQISGAIVAAAQAQGLYAPLNAALAALVRGICRG